MKRAAVQSFLAAVVLLAVGVTAEAQQPAKIPRIGYLSGATLSAVTARTEAFRLGLKELGYVEGKNIAIEWRFAEGKLDRIAGLAAELVRLKVDIIVSSGADVTGAVKEATVTIPIVMAQDRDPFGSGFVDSLARPGRNITGLSVLSPELNGKRLELLKEIVPRLSRVAVFGTSTTPGNALDLKEVELAAKVLRLELQHSDVLNPKDIETAFRTAVKAHAGGVLMNVSGPVANSSRTEIAELAVKSRLPVIYSRQEYVEHGGLLSYGVSINDLDRRAASYVDKILKGAKPGDLPVGQPTKFDFIINLKAAKRIGLTIPPNVLARADKVIK
jgi:putative ABC transport system substrate-binding protein